MEGLLDGSATTAAFSQPSGLALLFNRLYAVDAGASAVRELDIETGAVRTIVGEGLFDLGDQDGAGTVARLQYPLDISADQMHRMLWVTDTYNNKIKRIGVNSEFVSSVAGAATAAFSGYLRDINWPHGGSIEIIQGEDMGARSRLFAGISEVPGSSIRVSGATRIIDED